MLHKALRIRRARAWLAAAGIATCTLLVLVVAGVVRSVRNAVSGYAGQRDIDVWVAPLGSDNFVRGMPPALIPVAYADSLRALRGVAAAQPMLVTFLPVSALHGTEAAKVLMLLAVGYEAPHGLGHPPAFARGQAPRGVGQVALDRAAAFRLGVDVGDTLLVAGHRLVISGLTSQTNFLASQFFFADLASSVGTRAYGKASYVLLRLRPRVAVSEVTRAITARFPDLNPHSRAAFVAANQREIDAGFLPLVALVGILGLGAATVLVVLLVHGAVEECRGNIAILLALGAETRAVRRGVLAHGLLMLAAGAALGTLAAHGLRTALDLWLPTIPLRITWGDVAAAVAAFGLTGLLAALVPVAQLQRVDPLEAFRP